jgi:hypothetical protein
MKHRLNASLNADFVAAVSDLTLIILAAADKSFAHEGIKPREPSKVRDAALWDSGG